MKVTITNITPAGESHKFEALGSGDMVQSEENIGSSDFIESELDKKSEYNDDEMLIADADDWKFPNSVTNVLKSLSGSEDNSKDRKSFDMDSSSRGLIEDGVEMIEQKQSKILRVKKYAEPTEKKSILWDRNVLLSVGCYGLLAFGDIVTVECIPLLCKLDIKYGGLSLTSSSIGLAISFGGIATHGRTHGSTNRST